MRVFILTSILLLSTPVHAQFLDLFDDPGSLSTYTLLNNGTSASGFNISGGKLRLEDVGTSVFFEDQATGPLAYQLVSESSFVAETQLRVTGASSSDGSLPDSPFTFAGLLVGSGIDGDPATFDNWVQFGIGNGQTTNDMVTSATINNTTVLRNFSLPSNSSGPAGIVNDVSEYLYRLRITRDLDLFSLYLLDPFNDNSQLVTQYLLPGLSGPLQVGLFASDLQGNSDMNVEYDYLSIQAVPLPAAVWLFGTGIIGLIGFSKRRKAV